MSGENPPAGRDRRYEAVVMWFAAPQPVARAAESLRGLVSEGALVGVIAPLAVAELTDLLASPTTDPADLVLCDSRDSGHPQAEQVTWTLKELWRLGVDPEDVMLLVDGPPGPAHEFHGLLHELADVTVVLVNARRASLRPGVTCVPGGSKRLRLVLADQLRLRRRHALPVATTRAGWSLVIEGFDPTRERVDEALLTLADGHVGTGGASISGHPSQRPWVVAAGVYDGDGPDTHLLTGPRVFEVAGSAAGEPSRRVLDLRTGVLYERTEVGDDMIESVRFASLGDPSTSVMRVECAKGFPAGSPLLPPTADSVRDQGRSGPISWMRVAASTGAIVAAATQARTRGGTLDRLATYRSDSYTLPDVAPALDAVDSARSSGFDGLLKRHRRAWARRWEDADVVMEGDDELQRAIRFALFHLMASVGDTGETAVGARGLTGTGYRGHVFWDADTFVLPFLAATHPAAARSMLEYRVRRLPAAMEAALDLGRAGARFPWESARTGRDVTPTSTRDRAGRIVPVRTGLLEEHIVADVAWATCCYVDWSGDGPFARGPGRRILVETARYWASRIQLNSDGSAHIYGVIGPDEYHESVDDNAYTNVMARWNLRRASEFAGTDDPGPQEREHWLHLADALVDGYDPDSGVYEQFAGFNALEPLIIQDVAPQLPVAADILLGAERVAGAQVIKQADVLLLHHLVPDEVVPGSLDPNLKFYGPRTAHGSSLSPATHASLLARAGQFDRSLEALNLASRMDLDDLTGSSAAGLHLATMGGLWQALAFGFIGLRPRDGVLCIDPVLPPAWSSLEMRVQFRGSRVRVRSEHSGLCVRTDRRTPIVVGGASFIAGPGKLEFRRRGPDWEPIT